ncbi:MAG: 50S ribosomal protein L22 [Candidatus Omnitrophica bacterium]|nr:50S ribosomal protein L22 [Candidatus Omnitrophota bacterium]
MIATAEGRYIRISPRKIRQVLDLIRGKDVLVAEAILLNINKRPKEPLIKILRSAIANAKQKGFMPQQLWISKAICNVGPMWKRYKAAAFGRATPILRRTSHVRIELELKA